jgi:hypothetical protein
MHFQLRHAVWSSVFVILVSAGWAAAPKWIPLDPGEFTSKEPQVDKEAGAEIIFREVVIDDDSSSSSSTRVHVQAHVYDDRGIQELAKVEVPYGKEEWVRDLAARTVKPDGTVIELDPKDVFDRETLKAGDIRQRVKSFSPPGLTVGDVVEYKYTVRSSRFHFFVGAVFSGKLPARTVRYRISPLRGSLFGIRWIYFNCDSPESLTPDKEGFYTVTRTKLRANKEEPYALPDVHTQPTLLFYYTMEQSVAAPEKFWDDRGIQLHRTGERVAKPNKAVKEAVAKIIQGADDDGTKLNKIYNYCRTQVLNRSRASSGFTNELRLKLPENETASDTLKHGNGYPYDINVLFAALARAAGFDARLTYTGDRSVLFFNPKLTIDFSLSQVVVAVKRGETWSYFDPGATYLPPGMLRWTAYDSYVLISDPKKPLMQPLTGPAAEDSLSERRGEFTLSADGTLEGKVTLVFTGLREVSRKLGYDDDTGEERIESVKKEVEAAVKGGEVSNIVIENATDPVAPLKITYDLKVPEFAERTGSRLFVQPAVFQKGASAMFTENERRGDVLFNHRFVEKDRITIVPPPGYTIEAGHAPQDISFGAAGGYKVTLGVSKKSGALIYTRLLTMAQVNVRKEVYPALKAIFDAVNREDNHVLTLKRTEAAAAEMAPVPTTAPASATAPAPTAPAPAS